MDSGGCKAALRLQKVLNMGACSDHLVVKIVEKLSGKGASTKLKVETRRAKFESLKHTIKLPLMDGGEFDWDLCHPGLLVTRLVSESAALQAGFKDALLRHPCTPSRPWGAGGGLRRACSRQQAQPEPNSQIHEPELQF